MCFNSNCKIINLNNRLKFFQIIVCYPTIGVVLTDILINTYKNILRHDTISHRNYFQGNHYDNHIDSHIDHQSLTMITSVAYTTQ